MTPRNTVNELADGLRVSRHGGDGTWSWWVVVPTTGGPATHVAQGPFSLVVTGDLASMLFERPGGIVPDFINRDLETGVTQKCRAGDMWEYNQAKARTDLLAAVETLRADGVDPDEVDARADEAKELDFSDERAVHEWYRDYIDQGGDYPYLGRQLTHEFLRACACIEVVRRFQVSAGT